MLIWKLTPKSAKYFFFRVIQYCCCYFAGQLTIRSGLLIHGQPAVLYCSIPNFNDVGYWRKNGNQETRCDNAGFCAPITNTPYSFYSNATGIYLTIQTLTNTEQNVWTCAHAGYSTTTFTIDYNTNVFGESGSILQKVTCI